MALNYYVYVDEIICDVNISNDCPAGSSSLSALWNSPIIQWKTMERKVKHLHFTEIWHNHDILDQNTHNSS